MPGPDTILAVNDLSIAFGEKEKFIAVNKISFNIDKGKTLAIVGESGSGKSLMALALMGLLPNGADLSGEILLNLPEHEVRINFKSGTQNEKVLREDLRLATYDLRLIRGKYLGMVFQEPMSSLNPVMRVGKQLKEAIQVHQDLKNTQARELAIEWLAKVQLPEPEKIYNRYPHQLSGGQKQRIMIAMAMCNHPALQIADEPTTALDVTMQQEIIRLMDYLQQEHGSAMIFITHDLSLAATTADDVLVLYKGNVMEYGPAKQVLQQPQNPYTRALLACKPSAGRKGMQLPVLADYMAAESGTGMVKAAPKVVTKPAQEGSLIEVKNLRVWFPEHNNMLGKTTSYYMAVDDVSFTINKGETLGLVGESGCGKSTLSRSLIGLLPVNSGELLFKGRDLSRLPVQEWRAVRKDIQMIFQDPYSSLNPRMTIRDMLREPLRLHNIVPAAETDREVKRLLELVQLTAEAGNRYPHQFSGGQRQRIGIARALALRPQLLICDESVSALDVSIQAQILNLLKELQQEFGLTYLFISHDLTVVHYFSDRVMVMRQGKIIETGSADDVLKRPKEEYTRRLIEAIPF